MQRQDSSSGIPQYRIASLRDFLPLSSDDAPIAAPRGHHLPSIIQARSSTNLARPRSQWGPRRSSITAAEMPGLRQRSDSSSSKDVDMTQKAILNPHGGVAGWGGGDDHNRRMSYQASVLMTPEVRSQRLIGNTNPRYRWEKYWKTEEDLNKIKKRPIRKYYERTNYLVQHYLYIDRLLDSSLPHDLIQEYQHSSPNPQQTPQLGVSAVRGSWQDELPETIDEEENAEPPRIYNERHGSFDSILANGAFYANGESDQAPPKVKRTPKDMYSLKDKKQERKPSQNHENGEEEPLLDRTNTRGDEEEAGPLPADLDLEMEEETSSQSRIVTIAILVNLAANTALLVMKLIVVLLSSSVSVLASLVDAALDFLSTAIVGLTTRLISRTDQYAFPIGRRRLEPVGVLVFSVIMITAFIQVLWQALNGLTNGKHEVVELGLSAIIIMASTVVIKGACWLWCRLIKNSSVQALAQDAMTDVVFNTFSIIFPLSKCAPCSLHNSFTLTFFSRLLRSHLVARSPWRCDSVTLRDH